MCESLVLSLGPLFKTQAYIESSRMPKIRRKRCGVKHLEDRIIFACCIESRGRVSCLVFWAHRLGMQAHITTSHMLKIRRKGYVVEHLENRYIFACCI